MSYEIDVFSSQRGLLQKNGNLTMLLSRINQMFTLGVLNKYFYL
jgi:hypothetical protein